MGAIYVHIPFCHAKCAYCDFYSVPDTRKTNAVVSTIIKEYEVRRYEIDTPATLYFGGGTPSILPNKEIERLSKELVSPNIEEFTIEVNPEDVNVDAARHWKNCGVNRISMGIQSFCDNELKAIRRRHTAREAVKAVECLQSVGFDNISCDLIYGLPGQTLESWRASLKQLLSLNLTHFSAYCLSYEPGTILYRQRERGEIFAASDDLIVDMYNHLIDSAFESGFDHYEISNFGLPNYHSKHNSSYWDGTPYLGLGPGAHSCDKSGTRRYNPSNINKYLDSQPGCAFEIDNENHFDYLNDLIITGLRTSVGLDFSYMSQSEKECILEQGREHIVCGNLVKSADGSRIFIPEHKWLIADAIMRDLLFVD